MRKLLAVVGALVLVAGCSSNPTASVDQRLNDVRPSYDGIFGGSGNVVGGGGAGTGGGGITTTSDNTTATGTEVTVADSTGLTGRGGLFGGSGN